MSLDDRRVRRHEGESAMTQIFIITWFVAVLFVLAAWRVANREPDEP